MRNGLFTDKNNNKFWYKNDVPHRINGPAIEYVSGIKEWYENGLRHRVDGPAVEMAIGGVKWWYKNGKRHRLDGPAIETGLGYKEWYIDGMQYTKEEFKKTVLIMKLTGLI